MKKMIWMLLAALCLLWPAGSLAEGLPGFEEAIEAVIGAAAQEDDAVFVGPLQRAALTDGQHSRDEESDAVQNPMRRAALNGVGDAQDVAAMAPGAQTQNGIDSTDDGAVDGAMDGIAADTQDAAAEDAAQDGDLPEDGADDEQDADDLNGEQDGDPADTDALAMPAQDAAAQSDDLTLKMTLHAAKLSEGESMTLEITVLNPRTVATPVALTLDLPERLGCAQDVAWECVLPAAETDEQGVVTPSETSFIRELSLGEGGVGETVTLLCELNMGTRFYRAQAELELCVSDVSVRTVADGVEDGRVLAGQTFCYRIDVSNEGTAARDVVVELILPDGLAFAGELPKGFEQSGMNVHGTVRAEAAKKLGDTLIASKASVNIPVSVDEDALAGDDDALRLLTGVLRIDGERVSLPRVQVCGPQITARLVTEADSLEAGAQMDLSIVVANTGLAPASVRVSCLLPEGLSLAEPEEETATPGEAAAALPPEDGASAQAAVLLTEEAELPVVELTQENGTLIYDVYMDAATLEDGAVKANTRVITVRVQADEAQHSLREKLVGAALAYETGEGTQLAQAVAVRVYTPSFMGITKEEWGGIFWAAVLLVITVSCLYAAVKVASDDDDKDYCFD